MNLVDLLIIEAHVKKAIKRAAELEKAIVILKAMAKGNDNPELNPIIIEAEQELATVKSELNAIVAL